MRIVYISSTPLPYTSLGHLVNHLAEGKAPKEVSRFLAGATLVALPKLELNCPPDVHPVRFSDSEQESVFATY